MIKENLVFRSTISAFFVLFFCGYLQAQYIIKGSIKGNENSPVSFVSVLVKKDTLSIINYTYSNDKGEYSLKINDKGDYNLKFSALSYKAKTIPITLNNSNKELTINIVLEEELTQLDEVIIRAEKSITVKKDTVSYKTKFFLKGNEQVVEDVLKNIPGLNIDEEGTIKVEGREIEKLMIEGDDFFEKGYKILTKNMPSNPIDKVEVLKKYSNNKLLKGIDNSDKVALNLMLKEDAKRVWFGNLTLGYGIGSENRYNSKGNLMNFGKKNKYYFLSSLNNIGSDVTGDIWQLIKPFRYNEPASIGDDQQVGSILDMNTYVPSFKESRTLFNNTELISLNTILKPSKKIKIKTLGFFNWDENDFFRNSIETFNASAINFTNNEDYQLRKKRFTGFGKIEIKYDISNVKTLDVITKYNHQDENSRTDLVFNTEKTTEQLKHKNSLFDQKISYTSKFKKNKVFILTGRYIREKVPQKYTINTFFYNDLFPLSAANNVSQSNTNQMEFSGIEGHIFDRKENGDLLEFQFGNQYRKDKLSSSFLLNENQINIDSPQGYQNQTYFNTNDLYFSSKYRLKLKNFHFTGKLEFHQLFNQLEQIQKTSDNPFYIVPRIGAEWKINEKNKISALYTYSTTNAQIIDVYDNHILTGFRSFSKGSGEFDQLNATSYTLNYQLGDWGSSFFANTFILYNKNHDFYSTNSFISQNYSRSDKIIIKDRELLTISSNIDRYLKKISSNFKLKFGFSSSNYKNIVNTTLREISSKNYNYGLELRSGFSGIFNYHFGTSWSTNKITTTSSNSYTNNTSFIDLVFVVNNKLNFDLQAERYYFGNIDAQNDTYYFTDFNARYTVKENKLTFSLSGKNLFNTEKFKEFSISDIGSATTEYRLLPRYILLKMEYRF